MEHIGTNRGQSKVTSQLVQCMGITAESEAHYTVAADCLAYVCGSQIVIYDPNRQQQVKSVSHRTYQISCIAASPDGRYLAVADTLKDPLISIYDLPSSSKLLSKPSKSLPLKKCPPSLLLFSPNSKYLVTVSNQDNILSIYEDLTLVAKNKLLKRVNKMIFNQDGNLMTAGQQHLKIWNFNQGNVVKVLANQTWMMEGKNVGLRKEMFEKEWVSVASRGGVVLGLTGDGFLVMINKDGNVFKHAYINMESASCLEIIGREAYCGGKNADIRVFNVDTLQISRSFSKPPPIGKENIQKEAQLMVNINANDKYPRCCGIRALGTRIAALYENKMMFIWNITDKLIIAEKSFLGHRSEIVCISLLEEISESITFFATSSLDKTIRIWHIYEECFDNLHQSVDIAAHIKIKRNVYCKNLTRIIYTEEIINFIKCFKNRLLALSKSCLYFFLLTNFEFQQALTLDAVIDSVELQGDKLYLGCEDMTIRIYEVVDATITQSAVYKIKHKIQQLLINSKEIFCLGNGKLSIISQQSKTLLKEVSNITSLFSHNKFVYWTVNNLLTVHNPSERKTKPPIQLKALLQPRVAHIIRATSSYILTAKTDQMPNIVTLWDLDGKFLTEERIGEAINDIMCAESGDTVFVGKSGAMIIWSFVYCEKVKKFREIFKDKLTIRDSLFGSVWMEDSAPILDLGSRQTNFNNARNAESKVIVVESPDQSISSLAPSRIPQPTITIREETEVPKDRLSSIRLKKRYNDTPPREQVNQKDYFSVPVKTEQPISTQPEKKSSSPKGNAATTRSPGVLDINIPLTKGGNTEVLNPSHVCLQTNQILENISAIQNRMGWQDRKIFESSKNIEVIDLGEDDLDDKEILPTESINVPKQNLMTQNTSTPKQKMDNFFNEQDCNSIQFKGSPKIQTPDLSIDPFDSFKISKDEKNEDSIVEGFSEQSIMIEKFSKMIKSAEKMSLLDDFVETNYKGLQEVYSTLHKYFGKKSKERAALQIQKLNQQNTKRIKKIMDDM